jgi:hypothetical protein
MTLSDKNYYYACAVVLTLCALVSLQELYMECKLGWLGTEMDAVVAYVPLQAYRSTVKHMYVAVGERQVPVLISGPDYAQKRFREGQIIKVKYHAASGKATLSGELNWRIIFTLVLCGWPAVYCWITAYRTKPEIKSKWKRVA